MRTNDFQQLALNFLNERTERNFEKLYKQIRIIALSASKGLTVRQDDYETIVSNVAMKLYTDIDKIYETNKSILSFVYISCKRKYFSLKRGYDKTILASSLSFKSEDGDLDVFETIVNNELDSEIREFELESAQNVLHNSPKLQIQKIKEIIKEICTNPDGTINDDEVKMINDIFTLRNCEYSLHDDNRLDELRRTIEDEVGCSSEFITPQVLANVYGVGRTTISARRTRISRKIKSMMSKMLTDSENGKTTRHVTTNNGVVKSCEYVGGMRNGVYKEVKNGVTLVEGEYKNNKRIGVWHYYYENGNYMGYFNHVTKKSVAYLDENNDNNVEAITKLF